MPLSTHALISLRIRMRVPGRQRESGGEELRLRVWEASGIGLSFERMSRQ
jgi:hypothetical protein